MHQGYEPLGNDLLALLPSTHTQPAPDPGKKAWSESIPLQVPHHVPSTIADIADSMQLSKIPAYKPSSPQSDLLEG